MRRLILAGAFILAFALSAAARDGRDPGAPPTLAQLAELTASDGAPVDNFGVSVAISGNTVVVGANYAQIGSNHNEGAAYVFVKSDSGWTNMTQVAKLTASNGYADMEFGTSVAISGNTIVVGAIGFPPGAYVFVMPTGGWRNMTETAELTDPYGGLSSVAISGNVVVVGDPSAPASGYRDDGAVFVYVKPKGGWKGTGTYTAELTASDANNGVPSLGWSVAISGNTIIAGGIYDTVGSALSQGATYVFVEPAGGWKSTTQSAKLTASDGEYQDYLGWAVGISGSTVIAGAPGHPTSGTTYLGSAYVFVKPAKGWTDATQTAELTGSSCRFGNAVAVSTTEALAADLPSFCNNQLGMAYVYNKPKAGWVTTSIFNTALSAADGFGGDGFGASISVSGPTVVIGATRLGSGFTLGAAYVF